MRRWAKRLVCRYSSHDWWALAYPPARRWECHRCGAIVEEAATGIARPPIPLVHKPSAAGYGRPGAEEASDTR